MFILSVGLGGAMSATYKIIPAEFPSDVGAVGGMVGALGGLAGFALPILAGQFVFLFQLPQIWSLLPIVSLIMVALILSSQAVQQSSLTTDNVEHAEFNVSSEAIVTPNLGAVLTKEPSLEPTNAAVELQSDQHIYRS